MGLWEFLTLVNGKQLLFRRLDRMRESDRAEGMLPSGRAEPRHLDSRSQNHVDEALEKRWGQCWRRERDECALMWRAYAPRGVAVRTSFSALKKAMMPPTVSEGTHSQISIAAVPMIYADVWTDRMKKENFEPIKEARVPLAACVKRVAFHNEEELRLVARPRDARIATGIKPAPLHGSHAEVLTFPEWLSVPVASLDWIEKLVIDEAVDPVFVVPWLALLDTMTSRVFHRGQPLTGAKPKGRAKGQANTSGLD